MLRTGILGINARNLLYLRPFNKKRAVQLADNKLKTKQFLGTRGIPVAKLYAMIRSQRELEKFDWATLPKNFIVKPNRGYGGEGFRAIHDFDPHDTERIRDLHDHIQDILDGNYSLSNAPDSALFEQEIIPHPIFESLSTYGLPDIRIIVFNLIPVMAMLRLPTKESGGVANLHQGGAIVGIDIATGEAQHMYYHGEYVDRLPTSTRSIEGFTIPNWDEILLIASKVQLLSNVGYLAADLTLDHRGIPMIMELNARGGLGIQLANHAPLRNRLERIAGLRVTTPEKGVRIGKDLFGKKASITSPADPITKQILGAIEAVEVLPADKGEPVKLIARIDPSKITTSIDRTIAQQLGIVAAESSATKEFVKAEFILGEKRIKTAVSLKDFARGDHQMVIGQRDLTDFLIDPSRSADAIPSKKPRVSKRSVRTIVRDNVHIDAQLTAIDRSLRLLLYLNPTNAKAQENAFFASGETYNPVFTYATPTISRSSLLRTISQFEPDNTPIGQLLMKKVEEVHTKIDFLFSVGTDTFSQYAEHLYGKPDAALITAAQTELAELGSAVPESRILTTEEVIAAFQEVLTKYGLTDWQIVVKDSMGSDCAVGKLRTLFVKRDAIFTIERITSLIAHEIETHVLTVENGKLQPYTLFAQGCAGYLTTQEGLAIYNQCLVSPKTEKYFWPAAGTVAIAHAMEHSFVDTYQLLRAAGLSADRAYAITFKVKRGMADTAEPGALTRSLVYFAGRREITDFFARGGSHEQLYLGKVSLADLDLIKRVEGLVPARYLPTFYK